MQRTRLSYLILFTAMVYVFFTLNAMYIQFSFFKILRWGFPILFIFIMFFEGRMAPPFITLYFVFLGIIPSVVLSPNIVTSGEKFISILLVIYGCYDFFYCMDYEKDMNRVVILISIVSLLFLILNTVFIYRSDSGRALGILTNANTLGVYSNVSLICSIYCYYKVQLSTKRFKYLFLLTSILSIVLTVLSQSRGAFAGMFVIIMAFLFIIVKSKAARWLFIVVSLALLIVFFSVDFSNSSISVLKRFSESGFNRGEMWDNGIKAFLEHPIFGCGFQMSYLYNEVEAGFFMILHNSYLSFLADCGIWGVVLLGIPFILSFAYFAYNIFTKIIKVTSELVFMLLILIAILISAYSESFLLSLGSTEGFLFWCVYAWVMAYIKKDRFRQLVPDNGNIQFGDFIKYRRAILGTNGKVHIVDNNNNQTNK